MVDLAGGAGGGAAPAAHLRKTVRIALIVGTVLFTINQLNVAVRGTATPVVWLKVALTYIVPVLRIELGHPHRIATTGVTVAGSGHRRSSRPHRQSRALQQLCPSQSSQNWPPAT
jgi:hypothetical protein